MQVRYGFSSFTLSLPFLRKTVWYPRPLRPCSPPPSRPSRRGAWARGSRTASRRGGSAKRRRQSAFSVCHNIECMYSLLKEERRRKDNVKPEQNQLKRRMGDEKGDTNYSPVDRNSSGDSSQSRSTIYIFFNLSFFNRNFMMQLWKFI
jgi:hypothetical protein